MLFLHPFTFPNVTLHSAHYEFVGVIDVFYRSLHLFFSRNVNSYEDIDKLKLKKKVKEN